jgi:hypothetical protein
MTINMPQGVLEAGFAITVFGVLIAFYLWVVKVKEDLCTKLENVQKDWAGRLDTHAKESDSQLEVLARSVNELTVQVVQRLTAIETTLKERRAKEEV